MLVNKVGICQTLNLHQDDVIYMQGHLEMKWKYTRTSYHGVAKAVKDGGGVFAWNDCIGVCATILFGMGFRSPENLRNICLKLWIFATKIEEYLLKTTGLQFSFQLWLDIFPAELLIFYWIDLGKPVYSLYLLRQKVWITDVRTDSSEQMFK